MSTPAEVEFNTSSKYPVPDGYTPWKIRNDYPAPKPSDSAACAPEGPAPGDVDAPWLDFDPRTDSEQYIEIVKLYCFDGMVDNDFIPQNNTVRDWYHAPWMHYSPDGREPLHGLTYERPCPPGELSDTQERYTQTWAVGFFNSPGASVFGGMWKDPNNPEWTQNLSFPLNSLVYKVLLTDATDDELPILVGAPAWDAITAVQEGNEEPKDPGNRNKEPSTVRLLQVDFAVRDDRSCTGWIFGTLMYDGSSGQTGYDGLIPVGLQWGNDPAVTQEAYDAGARPVELWINPNADEVRMNLHGYRPSWGWNDRMNGPADNFISACMSCHSTAQWPPTDLVPPMPKEEQGKWVPEDDAVTMKWFRNIPCGTPFTDDGAISADYSLQLMIGYGNYKKWLADQGGVELPPSEQLPAHPRAGPHIPRKGFASARV